jgi:hypothetical protein
MKIKPEEIELYNDLLLSMQNDIIYIILKYRRSAHFLSVKEIAAEVNYGLIKYRDSSIKKSKECLTKVGFSKLLYSSCLNRIKWTCKGVSGRDIKYFNNKAPNLIVNENGDTLFDFLCNSKGEEDELFKETESSDKYKNIIKWIYDYSDFLTEKELLVLKERMKGLTLDQIGKNQGLTHQAISCSFESMREKVNSYIKANLNLHYPDIAVKKARKSMNRLFR